MQVKMIFGNDLFTLERWVNEFLETLEEDPKEIKYDLDKSIAIVEYESPYAKALCCDCSHWDDSISDGGTMGTCQICGSRKRFNCKACRKYKDVRG